MERIYVVPAPGKAVPDPDMGDYFPAEGRETIRSLYVERRLADGALTIGAPPPEPTTPRRRTNRR